ncbi:hypothetical protein HHK36_006357 [Tetracentron sinense]|uniref:Uncharacterized protein n=1 Tax=Tetracentron sinense TaxID=13715 RepID=A0A834ZKQ7_TETSI|nr:hypothetical protein HHK36_006357 [Tetracentron sinense]
MANKFDEKGAEDVYEDLKKKSARETTGASMNPVRTLGPAIATNNYKANWVTAPIFGALSGASVYSTGKLLEDEAAQEKLSSVQSLRR